MIEIRFHGRGGQKLAARASALALAALKDGKYSQTYLSFGLDRPGAPNTAITRVADAFIRERAGNGSAPDVVVVLDATVIGLVDVSAGLKAGGTVIAPTDAALAAPTGDQWRVQTVETAGMTVAQGRVALLQAVAQVTGSSASSLQAALKELKLA